MKNGFIVLTGCFLSLSACKKGDERAMVPDTPPAEMLFSVPSNFPAPAYNLTQNPLTADGVALGKNLFYDGMLSGDGTVSCGSCHIQSSGFTQHGHILSHGIDGKLTRRNSLPLQNLAWEKTFMWDGGVVHLDVFAPVPIAAENEMGASVAFVLQKLRKSDKYPGLFKKAYGTDEVTTERFLKALSQFMLTMVSADSRYDRYIRKEPGGDLTASEMAGLQMFKQKCATCHQGDLFTDLSFRSNGLPPQPIPDKGRGEITLNPGDNFKFKVPSLRNVEVTLPYMHDGRLATLADVLEHYSKGMDEKANPDPVFKQPDGKSGIPLTAEEKTNLIAFLKTLTDKAFLENRKLSEF
jgi:cytochrome c peroxidase